MSLKTNSPTVNFYQSQENEWASFIKRNIPNAVLMRWQSEHRVFLYDNRIYKVEKSAFRKKRDFKKSLEYEFKILSSSKALIKDFCPKYYEINNNWDILEINFVEGIFLEELLQKEKIQMTIIFKIISKLFSISLAGIFYKQLRARHIIIKENNEVFFIDFGHSNKTNTLQALIQNFSPIRYVSSKWEEGRFFGIVLRAIKLKVSSKNNNNLKSDLIKSANQRWKMNQSRHSLSLPSHLKTKFNDDIATKYFFLMEDRIFESVANNPKIALDTIQFQFDTYGMTAHRDWGFIWDAIRKKINFEKKVIIDIGSCMGGVAAFSRIEGAQMVFSFEEDSLLMDASKFFSQALGLSDNNYHLCSFEKINNLPKADIIFLISSRYNYSQRNEFVNLIADYEEVVFLSESTINPADHLLELGFNSTDFIVKVDSNYSIFYSKK